MVLTVSQRRGWEPDAVLNWLALAGWGTHTEPSDEGDQPAKTIKAPDSTTVMNLSEIINNVCFVFSQFEAADDLAVRVGCAHASPHNAGSR
jgi:hypothetical protein